MSEAKRSKITDEHRKEAVALKALWDDGRPRRTQAVFGEAYGLGNQANVGHYLLGRSPLNIKAALAFASELKCSVSEFSPRIAAEIAQLRLPATTDFTDDSAALERQLVQMFRELPIEFQNSVLSMVNGVHNMAFPGKSAANPYPATPLPPPVDSPKHAAPPPREKAAKKSTKKTGEITS